MSQGCGVEWGTLNLLAAGAASRYFAGIGLLFFLPPTTLLFPVFDWAFHLPGAAAWIGHLGGKCHAQCQW